MKEISRRAMNNESEGMACGPSGIYAVDAEIVVEDEGKIVYLHTQWVSEVADSILFEATTESVYDEIAKINELINGDFDEFEEACKVLDRIRAKKGLSKNEGIDISERYAEQYQQLVQMMQEILDQDGMEFDLTTMRNKDEDFDDEDFDEEDEDYEDEDFEYELPESVDKKTLYLMRLFLETDIETESVFKDMDGGNQKYDEVRLQAVNERIEDESDYLAWKQAYLEEEYTKVKDQKFLTCTYLFAGIGQYEMTIPADEKKSFLEWIRANGSAFFGGERNATEEEIKRMIALNAPVDFE